MICVWMMVGSCLSPARLNSNWRSAYLLVVRDKWVAEENEGCLAMKLNWILFDRLVVKIAMIFLFMVTLLPRVFAVNAIDTGDTFTQAGAPLTNSGSAATLVVSGLGSTLKRSWIQFDLLHVLPSGVTADHVTKATLKLWTSSMTASGAVNVFAVTGTSWSEITLTNNNAPGVSGSAEGSFLVSTAGNFVTFDLTFLVQDWIDGLPNGAANFGIVLVPATSTVNVAFDSKESTTTSHEPQLDIVLTSGTIPASQVSGLSAVATSGSYASLIGLPTIPTNTTQLTNGAGYIISSGSVAYATSAGTASLLSGTIASTHVTGFSAVATTGSFGSLLSKPTTLAGYGITDSVVISGGTATNLTLAGSSNVTGAFVATGTSNTMPNQTLSGGSTSILTQKLGDQRYLLSGSSGSLTLSGTVSAAKFVGSGANLTNLSAASITGNLPISQITGLSAVATSGSYASLIGLPTIPTNTTQLTNGSGYITSSGSAAYAASAGTASVLSGTIATTHITGLSTVATTGSFGSLLTKPTTLAGYGITDLVVVSGGTATNLTLAGSSNVTGAFTASGTSNTMPNQTLSGGSTSILTQKLGDQRYLQSGSSGSLTLSGTVSAAKFFGSGANLTNLPASSITGNLPASQITGLSAVATSGSYASLIGLPTIPTNTTQLTNGSGYITSSGSAAYAVSAGTASVLSGTIATTHVTGLSSVATTGSFGSLLSKPTTLAGYGITDLVVVSGGTATNLTLSGTVSAAKFVGSGANLTNLSAASITGNLPASQITGLSAVATSGSYASLIGLPTIPTNTTQLTNGSGFITASGSTAYAASAGTAAALSGTIASTHVTGLSAVATTGSFGSLLSKPTTLAGYGITDLVVVSGGTATNLTLSGTVSAAKFVGSGANLTNLSAASITGNLPASQITGLSAVATSGSYASLIGLPTIPTNTTQLTNGSGFITASGSTAYAASAGTAAALSGTIASTHVTGLSAVATTGSFGSLLSRPTTLAGYGITDSVVISGGTVSNLTLAGSSNITGSLIANGTSNTMPNQTLSGGSTSVLTQGLADQRYLQSGGSGSLILSGTVSAAKFVGSGANLTNLSASSITGNLPALQITGLSAVATSGSYASLIGLPTIPTNTTQLSNGSGYITSSGSAAYAANAGTASAVSGTIASTQVAGLSSVATTGSFGSLLSRPTTLAGYGITDSVVVSGGTVSNLTLAGSSNLTGSLIANGTSNTMPNQTLSGGSASVLTQGLADQRYLQTGGSGSLIFSGTVSAANFAGNGANLTNVPAAAITGNLPASQVTGLSAVATNGSYASLTGLPTIPTNTTQLTNGSGFITSSDSVAYAASSGVASTLSGSLPSSKVTGLTSVATLGTFSSLISIPTTLSGYGITDPVLVSTGTYSNPIWLTSLDYAKLTGAPTNISAFTNDAGYVQSGGTAEGLAVSGTANITGVLVASGTSNTMPNQTLSGGSASVLTQGLADQRYIQSGGSGSLVLSGTVSAANFAGSGANLTNVPAASITGNLPASQITGLSAVATNGSYASLSGLPTIPTNTTQLTNGSGFITSSDSVAYAASSGVASTLSGSLPSSKVTGLASVATLGTFSSLISIPTTLSGYGITDPVLLSTGTYSNPIWLTSLDYTKLTGAPTNVSAFTNDAGYVQSGGTAEGLAVSGTANITGVFVASGTSNTMPNQTLSGGSASVLTQGLADQRYIQSGGSGSLVLSGTVSAANFAGSGANLTNVPAASITGNLPASQITGLSAVATNGSYASLSGLPTIPTDTTELTNGTGYITSSGSAAYAANAGTASALSGTIGTAQITGLSLVATTGSFGALLSKPTTLAGYGITDSVVVSGGTATNLMLAGNTNVVGLLIVNGTSNTMPNQTLSGGSTSILTQKLADQRYIQSGSSGNLILSGTVSAAKFAGNGANLTNVPAASITGNLPASQITGLSAVATNGSYASLSGVPTIPTDTTQLTNGTGYITSSGSAAYAGNAGVASSLSGTIGTAQITGLSVVATTGSFDALLSKPTTLAGYGITDSVVVSGGTATNLIIAGTANITGVLVASGTSNTMPNQTLSGGSASVLTQGLADQRYIQSGSSGNLILTGTVSAANFAGNGANLTNVPAAAITGNLPASQVTGLSAVATNGSYASLTGLPTIPTDTTQLTNGSGFITSSDSVAYAASSGVASTLSGSLPSSKVTGLASVATLGTFSSLISLPTTLSGYGITDPVLLSTGTYSNPIWLTSLDYAKLTGAPTNVSAFVNDAGYVVSGGTASNLTTSGQTLVTGSLNVIGTSKISNSLIVTGSAVVTTGTTYVAKSGQYILIPQQGDLMMGEFTGGPPPQ